MQNAAKNDEFFNFSKSALGKIFYLIVLGLYTHELYKNAKKRMVISFLSQTLCETAVRSQWDDLVMEGVQMGMRHRNLVTAPIKAVSKKGIIEFNEQNAHSDLNFRL